MQFYRFKLPMKHEEKLSSKYWAGSHQLASEGWVGEVQVQSMTQVQNTN